MNLFDFAKTNARLQASEHTQPTQTAQICQWLWDGNTITPIQALNMFGCFRLGARIWELRELGYDIETNHVTRNGKTFAEYRMTK